MNYISTYLDIIIFAVIAVALLYRLRSVFGQRHSDDPPGLQIPLKSKKSAEEKKAEKNGIKTVSGTANFTDAAMPAKIQSNKDIQKIIEQMNERWAQNLPNFNLVASATVHNSLIQFPAFDPSFRPDDFLDKARKAFGLIVQAYSEGNKNTLEFLLSPTLRKAFVQQIESREEKHETYFTQINTLKSAIISDADLEGSVARVTVDFVADQSITHKDKDGNFINGHTGQRVTTKDRWVFMRDLKDSSLSWVLENTLAHEE